jgi:hypothetical protein
MTAEKTAELLSKITGAPFQVSKPHPEDPVNREKLVWFVSYRDASFVSKVPYVQRAWKSKGEIILESTDLGDMLEWIELAYGEEAAGRSLNTDYSGLSSKELQTKFGKEYPLVYQKIRMYEGIVTEISKKRSVRVELRYSGSKGILTFTFTARLEDDPKSLETRIEANVEALKHAYGQAMKA